MKPGPTKTHNNLNPKIADNNIPRPPSNSNPETPPKTNTKSKRIDGKLKFRTTSRRSNGHTNL
jgi:hypothetical protein